MPREGMMGLRRALGSTRVPLLSDLVLMSQMMLARRTSGFLLESRPGEFGSPIPNLKEIRQRERSIFDVHDPLAAINLREDEQLELVGKLSELYQDQPFGGHRKEGLRYYPENDFFGVGEAFTLHCILRLYRPERIVEVGSGFSSAVILDTNDLFMGGDLSCTFIDPNPKRLTALLSPEDKRRVIVRAEAIQQTPLAVFDELEDGDVLFIDSSHVSKVGSDLNRLIFDVLPRLQPGVIVHFHDIYYPFEYPKEWVFKGRAWNENYILRAFLMFNNSFDILLFNAWLDRFHSPLIAQTMPMWAENIGTSLWLQRAG